MIVCHCQRVCDRTIRAAIRQGACTEEAVTEACGAGGVCGGCVPTVTELIEEEANKAASALAAAKTRLPMISTSAA
jgi:bacterioferritin-associated ferredoxin